LTANISGAVAVITDLLLMDVDSEVELFGAAVLRTVRKFSEETDNIQDTTSRMFLHDGLLKERAMEGSAWDVIPSYRSPEVYHISALNIYVPRINELA
jgi:hypothetical protein